MWMSITPRFKNGLFIMLSNWISHSGKGRSLLATVGKWVYLYRAVDKEGNTIDFMLSETRDRPAVLKFFKKSIGCGCSPTEGEY